jgi:hypothetical protein
MADLGERIARWQVGGKAAMLRRLARIYLKRERPGHSFQRRHLA